MILEFIVSANINRRHMNPGQKAMTALGLEPMFAAAIKAQEARRKIETPSNQHTADSRATTADLRQSHDEESPADHLAGTAPAKRSSRTAAGKAAKSVGASARATQQAKTVKRDAPDLAEKVTAGETTLDAAYKQARQRKLSEPKPEPVRPGPGMVTLLTNTGESVQYPKPKSKATFNESKGEGISWASWSWNPVTGCLHGCEYCYARDLATRQSYAAAYPAGFTPLFHHERLDAPANTAIPAAHRNESTPCQPYGCPYLRVFVCSMADLYGRWVPDEWIQQVHASMLATPTWEYLLLTKFPSRYVGLDLPSTAWVGTSVDEQKRVRIAEDAFRQIDDVRVKWLSLEPLREPLEFTDLSMFDWVVIGAQTETRQPGGVVSSFAPPFEWVASIVAQAREAGCRVHLKPNLLGAISPQLPGMQLPDEYPDLPERMAEPSLFDLVEP
jgi:protein gp37